MPRLVYHSVVSFIASMRTTIPLLATIGIILCIVGAFLLYLPKLSFQRAIVVLLLVSVILFSNLPIAFGEEEEQVRWYGELSLQQPRNALGISAHIYVYDNRLSVTNPDPFVAFRIIVVRRQEMIGGRYEWFEAGYFEHRKGFEIFSASYIENNYVLYNVTGLSGEGADGEWYLRLTIGESENNKFEAKMYDPIIGIWYLGDATFTIGGDNLYLAGSESNDTYNGLNGHYADLYYSDEESGYAWQDVEPYEDYPYSVIMGASNNEFFTEGGLLEGDFNDDGEIDYEDVFLFIQAYNDNDLIADLNGDGIVDYADANLMREIYLSS